MNQSVQHIQSIYAELEKKQSNLVFELLTGHEVLSWQHYPQGDVKDKKSKLQYYFHSHPSISEERFSEYGHLHVFAKQAIMPKEYEPIYVSKKYEEQGKDDLCHLFAISMNQLGFPIAFFTTNHWVTRGLWYPAEAIEPIIRGFKFELPEQYHLVNNWLTEMVRLFQDNIIELVNHRDVILKQWQEEHPECDIFEDRNLEVLSVLPLVEGIE